MKLIILLFILSLASCSPKENIYSHYSPAQADSIVLMLDSIAKDFKNLEK